jgi:hypothetical protein
MNAVSSPTADAGIIAGGLEFPEGPIAMPDGSVLVTEAAAALSRVAANGNIDWVEAWHFGKSRHGQIMSCCRRDDTGGII